MKKNIKRIKRNGGSIPLDMALLIPFILLLCFVMIDFIYISNQKVDIQRRADSAALTIANSANAEGEINVNSEGIIISGPKAGCKVCAITEEDFNLGINQLRNDLSIEQYDSNYFESTTARYDKLSDQALERMENGVVRISFKGKVYGYLSRISGFNWGFNTFIDSTAVCNGSAIINDEAANTMVHGISYILYGGHFNVTPAYSYISIYGYNLPIPEKDGGYTFEGWYRDEDFSDGPYTEINPGSHGNLTFYAKWRKETMSFNIKYIDYDTNQVLQQRIVNLNYDVIYNIPVLNIENYDFYKITYPINKTSINTSTWPESRDIVVTYKEKIKAIELDYITDSLQEKITIQYKKSSGNINLFIYDKEFINYDFKGYYLNSNGTNPINTITPSNYSSINKIYAVYTESEYKKAYWITKQSGGKKILEIYPNQVTNSQPFDVDVVNCPWAAEKTGINEVVVYNNGTNNVKPKYINTWFNNMPVCEKIDIQNLNTKDINDFSSAFENDIKLIDVLYTSSTFRNGENFSKMFKNCSKLGVKASSVSKEIINESDLDEEKGIELTHGYFHVISKAKDLSEMFYGTKIKKIDLTDFDMKNVESTKEMFKNCTYLSDVYFIHEATEYNYIEETVVNFNSLITMEGMFENCSNLGIYVSLGTSYTDKYIDVSYVHTATVRHMKNLFKGCVNLKTIYAKSNGDFKTDSVIDNGENMFYDCLSIVGSGLTNYSLEHVDKGYARIGVYGATYAPGYFTELQEFDIIYHLNGGSFGYTYNIECNYEKLDGTWDTTVQNFETDIRENVTVGTNRKEGFTLDDTIEGSILSGDIDEEGQLTLRAFYTRNKHSIIFNTNGGNTIDPIEYKYDERVTIPIPTNGDKIFVGWSETPPLTMPDHDVVLNALWQEPSFEHTITFMTGGGTEIEPMNIMSGSNIIKPADPIKEGFRFIKWEPEIPDVMPNNDLTVVAVWGDAGNRFTVTYILNNGQPTIQEEYVGGGPITPPANPILEGYNFVGWEPELPSTMPTHDIVVNATFEDNLIPNSFATDTYAKIHACALQGNSCVYSVGDEREIELTDGRILTLKIYDISSNGIGVTTTVDFGNGHPRYNGDQKPGYDTNKKQGYAIDLEIELYAFDYFYNLFPTELQDIIISQTKDGVNRKLHIPSKEEINASTVLKNIGFNYWTRDFSAVYYNDRGVYHVFYYYYIYESQSFLSQSTQYDGSGWIMFLPIFTIK